MRINRLLKNIRSTKECLNNGKCRKIKLYRNEKTHFITTDSSLNVLQIMINTIRGARGVMVIIVENGHSDTCSNPG